MMKYTINNSIRNALCIVLLSMLLPMAHAEEGIEATVGNLAPTPAGTISPKYIDDFQALSTAIGEGLDKMKSGRTAFDNCGLEFESSNKDDTAHAQFTECLVAIGYAQVKQGFEVIADGFEKYANRLTEHYKDLSKQRQKENNKLETAQQELREYENQLKRSAANIGTVVGKIPEGADRLDAGVRSEAKRLLNNNEQLLIRKRSKERKAKYLGKIINEYDNYIDDIEIYKEEAKDSAYAFSQQKETLDVVSEDVRTMGIAAAGLQERSGIAAGFSEVGTAIKKLVTMSDTINDLMSREIPFFDFDDRITTDRPATIDEIDDRALIEQLRNIVKEQGGE